MFFNYYFAPWIRFARRSPTFGKTCCLDSLFPAFSTHSSFLLSPHHWELQCKTGLICILQKTKSMTCFLLRSCLLTFWKRLVYVPSQPLISPWRRRLRSTEQSHIRRHFCRPAFPPASFIWHPSSQAWDEAAFLWQRPRLEARLASPRLAT